MNTFVADTVDDTTTNYYGTKTRLGNPRIYNCDQCKRAFTREEHLTRHTLLTHNKLKPFTCGICSRPFSRRDLLLRHAKNLHQGSELAVSRIRKSYKSGENDREDEIQENGINVQEAITQDNQRNIHNINNDPSIIRKINNQVRSNSDPGQSEIKSELPKRESFEFTHSQTSHPVLHTTSSLRGNILRAELSSNLDLLSGSSSPENEYEIVRGVIGHISDCETPEKKRMKMSVNMLVS